MCITKRSLGHSQKAALLLAHQGYVSLEVTTTEYWKEVQDRLIAIRKIDLDCELAFGSKEPKYKSLGSRVLD